MKSSVGAGGGSWLEGSRGQSARRSKLINAAAGAGKCTATREARPGLSESPTVLHGKKQIVLYLPVDDICCCGSRWPFHSVAVYLYFKTTAESIDTAGFVSSYSGSCF